MSDNLAFKTKQYRERTLVDLGVKPAVSSISIEERINDVHKTIITLTDLAISLSDAHVGGGSKIYTFPEGRILIHGSIGRALTPTTTSALASTLNASKTLSMGVGSVQTILQDSGTLATTEQDVMNTCAPVSSATINVAGTAANGKGPSAPLSLDGTTTPQPLWLNVGVPTATDIDGDATIIVNGVIEVVWSLIGDY